VSSTVLPGIGVRQDVELPSGKRVGVVMRRSGSRDLVFYRDDDPDSAAATIELTEQESTMLAELLGAPALIMRLQSMQDQASGLIVEQIPMPHTSPFADRPLGDAQVRSRTGASIVGVTRASQVLPSPAPDFVLRGGDLVVVVGTRDALDEVARILDGSG
jgi:TrkA domain protein